MLKASETYHLAYRAAFAWDAAAVLPHVVQPTPALAAADDTYCAGTRSGAALPRDGRFVALPTSHDPALAAARRTAITAFLA